MTCTPFRQEPSLSSMNERALASRRVRTQPWRKMVSAGAAALRASLTRVRSIGGSFVSRDWPQKAQKTQRQKRVDCHVPRSGWASISISTPVADVGIGDHLLLFDPDGVEQVAVVVEFAAGVE